MPEPPPQTCMESEYVAKFTRNEMAIYDSTKDQWMEKLKLKIVAGYEFYVKYESQDWRHLKCMALLGEIRR